MCTGPGEDECLLCIEGAELKKDDCEDKSGRCVCDENEFVSKEGCQKCHPLCQGCHGKGAQSCDRCALGAVWNDKGFCSCPAG